MRISHEAIYQALYIQGRGDLSRELASCLRTRTGVARAAGQGTGQGVAHVSEDVMISCRPAEVEERAVPGH